MRAGGRVRFVRQGRRDDMREIPQCRFPEIPCSRGTVSGMKVAMTNTKGGVGKTTSTIYLACALARRMSVEVIDIDMQGSATEWAQRAQEADDPLPFPVHSANLAQLRRLEPAADVTLIDTPPGDHRLIDAALRPGLITLLPDAVGGS